MDCNQNSTTCNYVPLYSIRFETLVIWKTVNFSSVKLHFKINFVSINYRSLPEEMLMEKSWLVGVCALLLLVVLMVGKIPQVVAFQLNFSISI